MKLLLFTLLLSTATHINACIRIHTQHIQNPWPEKDGFTIELYDDNNYYRCPGCVWESYSDQHCKVQCAHYTIEMYDYGRGGRVTNNNRGYTAQVTVAKQEQAHHCCLFNSFGTCRGNCQYWDTCNWDWSASHNCDKYRCGLCPGGKQYCGPDKKRSELLIGDESGNTTNIDDEEVPSSAADE